jgi:serine phosphatase RsbU (regulator of sigma subunit)
MEDALERNVIGQMSNLERWIELDGVTEQLEGMDVPAVDPSVIEETEARWPSLQPTDEPLRSILRNPMAEQLVRFQKLNPLFVELMLTDSQGRLIAATNPTTDYWQSDERWWIDAANATDAESIWAHGIIYDDSAGVQAMDITLPIRGKAGNLLGVVKGSLNAIDVLHKLKPDPWNAEISRDILFHDGRVFARLNSQSAEEPLPEFVLEEALTKLLADGETCAVVELYPGKSSLAVCVPVGMASGSPAPAGNHSIIYVLVHRDFASAVSPVSQVIRDLTINGSLLVVLIAILGNILSTIWFARPLRKLRLAASRIAEHFQQQEQGRGARLHRSIRDVRHALVQLGSIKTHDEMQDLAEAFAQMGGRVLNFHRRLGQELTRATEEINEDLVMAREFQEALLPDSYPQIPDPTGADAFNLVFSHIYRPVQSVSGDFFDISEVSKHCVRVVVADVMGHGARSALMTAILHALISDAAKTAGDPALLLQRMNKEFYDIGQRTGDTLFVTAIHLIIDTRLQTIRYAVAGHPSPLIIEHASEDVKPLIPEDQPTPAAGLLEDTVYHGMEIKIEKEQSILLYTDGVTEARNPQDEEFGIDRLIQAVKECSRAGRKASLPQYVLEILESYMDTAVAMDDICVVAIDVAKAGKSERAAKGE